MFYLIFCLFILYMLRVTLIWQRFLKKIGASMIIKGCRLMWEPKWNQVGMLLCFIHRTPHSASEKFKSKHFHVKEKSLCAIWAYMRWRKSCDCYFKDKPQRQQSRTEINYCSGNTILLQKRFKTGNCRSYRVRPRTFKSAFVISAYSIIEG